jgi:hypothetical protein
LAMAAQAFRAHVMVVPHPQRAFMHWPNRPRHVQGVYSAGQPAAPWCFSHVPAAGCFLDHHCEGRADKASLAARAAAQQAADQGANRPPPPLREAVRALPPPPRAWYCDASALARRRLQPPPQSQSLPPSSGLGESNS